MPIPAVTCSANVKLEYDASSQNVVLGAVATESPTAWEWTMLSVPAGSTANVGTNGDFTNGVAAVQNPNFDVDAGLERGSFVLQARAQNATGWSVPELDRDAGQQIVTVRSIERRRELPNDFQYDWGKNALLPLAKQLDEDVGGWRSRLYTFSAPEISYYIDEVSGDDANDGLSWGTAKKTLEHVWYEVLQYRIERDTSIWFNGTLTPVDAGFSHKIVGHQASLRITGENGYQVLSGPFTTTAASTVYEVAQTGAGWTVDEHVGKLVRVTTGLWAGRVRTVRSNSADVIQLDARMDDATPVGAGESFEFVSPNATLELSTNNFCAFEVDTLGSGQFYLQHFNFTQGELVVFGPCTSFITDLVSSDGSILVVDGSLDRSTTIGGQAWGGHSNGGVVVTGGVVVSNTRVSYHGISSLGYNDAALEFYNCIIVAVGFPTYRPRAANGFVYGVSMRYCRTEEYGGFNEGRIRGLEVDGANDSGVFMYHCQHVRIAEDCVFRDNAGAGLLLHHSQVVLDTSGGFVAGAALGGSGNTGDGVEIQHGSRVRQKNGEVPTITGTANVSAPSGTSTWAAIDGGTPLSDPDGSIAYTDSTTGVF